jgi:hypothetical protein
VPKGKPRSVEVIEDAMGRFVMATYADGKVTRKQIDPNERPRRKPRKPFARATAPSQISTRKKQL